MWEVEPDYASNRTQAQRDAHYQNWLQVSGRKDTTRVWACFFRRYQRPAPPRMPHLGLVGIRASWTWDPATGTYIKQGKAA